MTPSTTLLDAARRGERDAQARLIDAHGRVVWALCRRLAHDPDDAFQDVWLHVFRRLDRYDPEGPAAFSTWLHTVTHRQLVDRHRARRRTVARERRVADAPAPSSQPSPHNRVAARNALERGLAALPHDQRRAVLLVHSAGLSLQAVADQEGVALGTVKSRLHRARITLARLLEAP